MQPSSNAIECLVQVGGWRLIIREQGYRRQPFAKSYVQPRSRKMRSKTGMGIPKSQSKMYPVAPAFFILLVKCIGDNPFLATDSS
jgi:hypothetical protein